MCIYIYIYIHIYIYIYKRLFRFILMLSRSVSIYVRILKQRLRRRWTSLRSNSDSGQYCTAPGLQLLACRPKDPSALLRVLLFKLASRYRVIFFVLYNSCLHTCLTVDATEIKLGTVTSTTTSHHEHHQHNQHHCHQHQGDNHRLHHFTENSTKHSRVGLSSVPASQQAPAAAKKDGVG